MTDIQQRIADALEEIWGDSSPWWAPDVCERMAVPVERALQVTAWHPLPPDTEYAPDRIGTAMRDAIDAGIEALERS